MPLAVWVSVSLDFMGSEVFSIAIEEVEEMAPLVLHSTCSWRFEARRSRTLVFSGSSRRLPYGANLSDNDFV